MTRVKRDGARRAAENGRRLERWAAKLGCDKDKNDRNEKNNRDNKCAGDAAVGRSGTVCAGTDGCGSQ